jgi:hypothetical protein
MYSHVYGYFEIRSNEKYSDRKLTKEVIQVLEETGVLIRHENLSFKNKDGFPWIEITCVDSLNGNYSSNGELLDECNLLAIITSKNEADSEQKYLDVLKTISAKLEWELILEEDEEGNEDILIYKP